MVFTSILVHGITVPMTKAFMRGVTLTRTLTQPGETAKRNLETSVSVADIRRVGVPVPLATYHSKTGGRTPTSATHIPLPNNPEFGTGLAASTRQGLDEEHAAGIQPSLPPEGRVVA